MLSIVKQIINIKNKINIKAYTKQAKNVIEHIKDIAQKSDQELKNALSKTNNDNNELLVALLCEVATRSLRMTPYPNQIKAIMALIDGKFIEMETGEGKTLVFSLASAALAIKERKVVISSANEYLSERDYNFNKPFFDFLGLDTSLIKHNHTHEEKSKSYVSDIIFCDLSEIAMDYLRSAMAKSVDTFIDIKTDVLLIDEADSVLLDKAINAITVSKPVDLDIESMMNALEFVKDLNVFTNAEQELDISNTDYDAVIYSISNELVISDATYSKYENYLISKSIITDDFELYNAINLMKVVALESAIRAMYEYQNGKHYIVHKNSVVPLDRDSGRAAFGKFYNSGVQQMLEIKEKANVTEEHAPLASISVQRFVSLFNMVLGMSGTLVEDREELANLYGADIVVIERNKPLLRNDVGDLLFVDKKSKLKHTIEMILEAHKKGQPVLVSARSEGEANEIASSLDSLMISFNQIKSSDPLNESQIVKKAGMLGAITISTSITGRGTDIILGGTEKVDQQKVIDAGGLLVIGYGRQYLAKLDRQLIGRSGRQGDVGKTVIISSLDDEILAPYKASSIKKLLIDAGVNVNLPIQNKGISKSLTIAQKRAHSEAVKSRKLLFSMLSEMESQRDIVFDIRKQLLLSSDEEFSIYLSSVAGKSLTVDEAVELRDTALCIFDSAYEDYRLKVKDIMSNIGLRGAVVNNMGVEVKKELFRTFEIFLNLYDEDIRNHCL